MPKPKNVLLEIRTNLSKEVNQNGKNKIKNLPRDTKMSREEMRGIAGGVAPPIFAAVHLDPACKTLAPPDPISPVPYPSTASSGGTKATKDTTMDPTKLEKVFSTLET